MADHIRLEIDNTNADTQIVKRKGGGEPPFGDMEQRIAKLEANMDSARDDLRSLKASSDSLKDSVSDLKTSLARIDAKLDRMPSMWQMISTVFAGAATVLGVMLAALSFGGDRFDGGVSLSTQQLEQIQRDRAQDEKFDNLLSRVDALLSTQATRPAQTDANPTE